MTTVYLKRGTDYSPMAEADLDMHQLLPGENFIVVKNPQTDALYFKQVERFSLPPRLYGKIQPHADRILNTYHDRPNATGVLLAGEKGSGKALRTDQHVYTPSGPKEIGSVVEGDVIYADDGTLTTVDGVFPQGERDLFEVTFNDGSVVVADGEHLWSVTQVTISRAGYSRDTTKMVNKKRTKVPRPLANKTTLDLKAALDAGTRFGVPLAAPVHFPPSDIEIDRYTVGLLIGDGSLNRPTLGISSSDPEIIEHLSTTHQLKHIANYDYRFVDSKVLSDQLTTLGLRYTTSNTKFIPDQLKYDSVENRFALLQGLMDTDGTVSPRGSITYTTVSQQLANDVVWLARSLGFRSSIQHARRPSYKYKGEKRIGQLAYTVQLTGANNINAFKLARKQARVKRCSSLTKTIVSITQTTSAQAVCIHVTHENHRFLTNDFTVTHNTQLARLLSVQAAKSGMPTIIINAPWVGDAFFKLIQGVNQPCVVLFDEFEKVYDSDNQKKVLTLLDGVFPSKKLFVITSNDKWMINDHMRNRPGRIYYLIDYKGLEEDFIVQYCEDNLIDQAGIPQIVRVSRMFAEFNFDMLKAVVEEMNRYGESPETVLQLLNARPSTDKAGEYAIAVFVNGVQLNPNHFWPRTIEGSPLLEGEIQITHAPSDTAPEEDDDDAIFAEPVRRNRATSQVFTVNQSHLVAFDAAKGSFEYGDPAQNIVIRCTRVVTATANYSRLLS